MEQAKVFIRAGTGSKIENSLSVCSKIEYSLSFSSGKATKLFLENYSLKFGEIHFLLRIPLLEMLIDFCNEWTSKNNTYVVHDLMRYVTKMGKTCGKDERGQNMWNSEYPAPVVFW